MEPKLVAENSKEIKIAISGRIDTDTENELETFVFGLASFNEAKSVVLDFEKVQYISSAGLRLLLKIIKGGKAVQVINVSHDVYDVFEMTGFIQLCTVQKTFRQVDITGCAVIGEGANGTVYRLDSERILKLYKKPDVLNEIIAEKAHAKYAFLQGIPTAISFDIVKVGERYGSVFELLEAQSVANLFQNAPESMDQYIGPYTALLKTLHAIPYNDKGEIQLPSAQEKYQKLVDLIKKNSPKDLGIALDSFVKVLPEGKNMLHGDCQPNNVMLTKDEMIFIDMDTLAFGDPIFDLGYLYATMAGIENFVPSYKKLFRCSIKESTLFWQKTFDAYYGDKSLEEKRCLQTMCMAIGYTQVLAFSIKHPDRIPQDSRNFIEKQLQGFLAT